MKILNTVTALTAAPAVLNVGLSAQTPKQPISNDLWNEFIHYTSLQSASSPVPCHNPPFDVSVVKYIANNISQTQATLFRDDQRKEFVLSIPGSTDVLDYVNDLLVPLVPYVSPKLDPAYCIGCLVHTGFLATWLSIADDATEAVQSSLASQPGYRLSITGHSLGAAIATLAFASFKQLKQPVKHIFTFGSPRVGNGLFADYVDSLSGATDNDAGTFYRVVHAADLVPRLIPTLIGYRHTRTEYWQTNYTTSAEQTFRCFGQEPDDCSNSLGRDTGLLTGDIPDHLYYTNIVLSSSTTICDA